MKPDIASRNNIKYIITKFYDKLILDEKMLPFFDEFLKNNTLESHLEIITDFWNDILFDTIRYSNNVMQKHIDKNALVSFEKEHFSIWVSYFFETVDCYFQGENAEKMKSRAASIATVMQLKMNIFKN